MKTKIGLVVCTLVFSQLAQASWTVGGSARVRGDGLERQNFQEDYKRSIGSRFRFDVDFKPIESVHIFFQPQFSKVWGLPDSGNNTSGATRDTDLSVHQAYLGYGSESLRAEIGRRELAYGNELILGSVGWSNIGRSFDLVRIQWKTSLLAIDFFGSKIQENSSASSGNDQDFFGVYLKTGLGDFLKEVDLYALYLTDSSGIDPLGLGLRMQSAWSFLDARVEGTLNRQANFEYQVDAEVGARFGGTRVSAEYFLSSSGYFQWFPTGHKWLGIADFFSRKNIQGVRAGVSQKISDSIQLSGDFHYFLRTSASTSLFSTAGNAYGSGSGMPAGAEVDLTGSFKLNEHWSVDVGGAAFFPQTYLSSVLGNQVSFFYFAQTSTRF